MELSERWKGYLSRAREGGDDTIHDRIRSPFHKDYDRILFSPAFRRLQDKTQVYPLAQNDNVRRRLTHSLEVASIGRCLGRRSAEILQAKDCQPTDVDRDAVGLVVAAASLAHDIGNPPFGHAGEKAIIKWFTDKNNIGRIKDGSAKRSDPKCISDEQINDFQKFDGNAQGFRILTSLNDIPAYGGMQLTAATLSAFVKYPSSSSSFGGSAKKVGIFQSEIDNFSRIASHCRLEKCAKTHTWSRNPLNYLMEAADDICYLCADVEDAYQMRLFSFKDAERLLERIAIDYKKCRYDALSNDGKISYLVANAIGNLIEEVGDVFENNFEAITLGQRDENLIKTIKNFSYTEDIRKKLREVVLESEHMAKIESMGFEIITYFLNNLIPAVIDQEKDKADPFCERFLRIVTHMPNPSAPRYDRILRVIDFISGMTDTYALKIYRELKGISQPVFAAP